MPDKYSLAQCAHYGRQLAAQVCQQRFATQPDTHLDGPALLQLTPVRQVNLLVLHQLLSRWQHEAEQLRSPYFDFAADAVRTALGQFMNVLSRHIAVGREALEPLLAQAGTDALLLATDPAAAFEQVLLPTDATAEVPLGYLRERLRYLDQSKLFFTAFVDDLPAGPALGREALRQRFTQYCTSHAQQLAPLGAPLAAELHALLPLPETEPQPAATPTQVTADNQPSKTEEAAPVSEAPAAPAPEPLAPEPPATAEAAPTPPVAAPAEVPLHEKLKATQPPTSHLTASLREAAADSAPSLAERAAPRVGSLREAISINQRYAFINELFNGENMEYHAAIDYLDKLSPLGAATTYIQHVLANRYDWSHKEEHVAKLLKLVERRFADA